MRERGWVRETGWVRERGETMRGERLHETASKRKKKVLRQRQVHTQTQKWRHCDIQTLDNQNVRYVKSERQTETLTELEEETHKMKRKQQTTCKSDAPISFCKICPSNRSSSMSLTMMRWSASSSLIQSSRTCRSSAQTIFRASCDIY